MLCHVMSCRHVMSCHVMSCHVMSCHVMSCHVMSCHVMSCHVMSCYVMTTVHSLHVRESKTVLDSKFYSLESGSPDTGFQIPSVSASWIQDSSR